MQRSARRRLPAEAAARVAVFVVPEQFEDLAEGVGRAGVSIIVNHVLSLPDHEVETELVGQVVPLRFETVAEVGCQVVERSCHPAQEVRALVGEQLGQWRRSASVSPVPFDRDSTRS